MRAEDHARLKATLDWWDRIPKRKKDAAALRALATEHDRLAELVDRLKRQTLCIFCGTVTEAPTADPVDKVKTAFDHATGCQERPEHRLAAEVEELHDHLIGINNALGGDRVCDGPGEIRDQAWRLAKIDALKAEHELVERLKNDLPYRERAAAEVFLHWTLQPHGDVTTEHIRREGLNKINRRYPVES